MSGEASGCPFDESDIQRCPFLRSLNKPTSFSFTSVNIPIPVHGAKGPIFEDGANFDMAFKHFHGKDGAVPLSDRSVSDIEILEVKHEPMFNPLATKAATISLSAFGPGGPFSFGSFSENGKIQNSNSSSKKEPLFQLTNFINCYEKIRKFSVFQKGNSSKHEAQGSDWFKTGSCPIAKSYRAVSSVLPLVAKVLQPPAGMKLQCPPAVVAARAALARTTFVKNLRPQPLPAKMLVIAALSMAANIPLGMWKEHTTKFSLSWFAAVHAAVPFITMLRKSVLIPKTAMALTVAASILGQVIGSRAERIRMKAVTERLREPVQTTVESVIAGCSSSRADGNIANRCSAEEMMFNSQDAKNGRSTSTNVCC